MTRSPHFDRIALQFLERFWDDHDRGQAKTLTEYLLDYPGFDTVIAEEYLRATNPQPASPTAAGDSLGPVKSFGPYRLVDCIGRGAQGTVYCAEEEQLGRRVALKVMRTPEGQGDAPIARFHREATLAARLSHPGICQIYGFGRTGNSAWIAMQFVPGETLSARIASEREQSSTILTDRSRIRTILNMFLTVARAAHAAHESGVVHRDIKPSNIMVTPEGQPILLDFGIARCLESEDAMELSGTGAILGTPAYMAPEQISGKTALIDRRVDVYAIGLSLYEALTLKRPFEAPARESLFRAILEESPPDPRSLNAGISRELKSVLLCALERNVDRRYRSARALADDLEAILGGYSPAVKPPNLLTRLSLWAKRRPAHAIAALLLGTLLSALAATGGYLIATWPLIERQRDMEAQAEIEDRLEAAHYAQHLHDDAKALRIYQSVLTLWPKHAEALAGMAISYARTGQIDQALETLADCSHPSLHGLKADILFAAGDQQSAMIAASRARTESSPLGYYLEGLRLIAQADRMQNNNANSEQAALEEARRFLWLAAQSAPVRCRAHYFRLAQVVSRLTLRPDAKLISDHLRTQWPKDQRALYWAGLLQIQDDPQSIVDLSLAAKIENDDAMASYQLGRALVRWNRDLEAISSFKACLEVDPNQHAARLELSAALQRVGQPVEAIAQLETLLRLAPDMPAAHIAAARIYRATGNIKAAAQSFDRALALDRTDWSIPYEFAEMLNGAGRSQEATPLFSEAVVRSDEEPGLLRVLAVHLSRNDIDLDRAEKVIKRAINKIPEDPEAYWIYGDVLSRLSRGEEAVVAYRKFLDRRPHFPVLREQLVATLFSIGQRSEAIEEIQGLLAQSPMMESVWELLRRSVRLKTEAAEALLIYQRFLPQLDNPSIPLDFAKTLEDLGYNEEAIDLYRLIVTAFPASVEAYRNLAQLLDKKRPPTASIESVLLVAEQAVNLEGGQNAEMLALLAELQIEARRHSEAIKSLEALIAVVGSSPGLRIDLDEVRSKLNKQREQEAKSRAVQ